MYYVLNTLWKLQRCHAVRPRNTIYGSTAVTPLHLLPCSASNNKGILPVTTDGQTPVSFTHHSHLDLLTDGQSSQLLCKYVILFPELIVIRPATPACHPQSLIHAFRAPTKHTTFGENPASPSAGYILGRCQAAVMLLHTILFGYLPPRWLVPDPIRNRFVYG